jgi:hypothetical protein
MILPAIRHISGEGLPRLLLVGTNLYTSAGSTTFTATSVVESGSPALIAAGLQVGNLIRSFSVTSGQPNKPVYAKVTSIDDTSDTITVDEWIGGTPTNNQAFTIDGYVVDLPRCLELTETFDPDNLVHAVWPRRKESKFRGWSYQCLLDYSQYVKPDTIAEMRNFLSAKATDRLILIPRRDAPGFQYNVYFNSSIRLSRIGKKPGYKKFMLPFQGKENLASWPILSGYGFGYAQNFGNQL